MEPCDLIQIKISEVWRYLDCHSVTICTSAVSMTMGRRLTIHPDQPHESGLTVISAQRKHVAVLVIWTSDKRSGAEEEAADIRYILNTQLRAQVNYLPLASVHYRSQRPDCIFQ